MVLLWLDKVCCSTHKFAKQTDRCTAVFLAKATLLVVKRAFLHWHKLLPRNHASINAACNEQ